MAVMIEHTTTKQVDRVRTVRERHELIAALDRRVPRVERAGELSIAKAAAELKVQALTRIEELEGQALASPSPDEDHINIERNVWCLERLNARVRFSTQASRRPEPIAQPSPL